MSVKGSKEFLVRARPDAVVAAIARVEDMPLWSGPHKAVTVESRHPDGRPHLVRSTVGGLGILDHELTEYQWEGSRFVQWRMLESSRQRTQIGSYTLAEVDEGTHIRFELELEAAFPMPDVILRKIIGIAMTTGVDSLVGWVEKTAG